ncbi:hypothetical protein BGZ74_002081, partial [Mortierella antarctica]
MPGNKRRRTNTTIPVACTASIKVIHIKSTSTVLIEQYKDSPNHTHSIEDSDKYKTPLIIKHMIKQEACKPYQPPDIITTIKEIAEKAGLGDLAFHLEHQEVANIQKKTCTSEKTYLIGARNLGEDMQDAVKYLQSKDYLCETFSVARTPSINQASSSNTQTQGLVFAHPWQLVKLAKHGWLTLMDLTHNTNKHLWKLFTLYVWDSYNCWAVGAHFLISNEDIEGVTEGLRTIRQLAPMWSAWYFLTDNSATEIASVKNAFPGITQGEQNCDTLLCTVHTMCTWMTKIYDSNTHNTMIYAMNKWTWIGCEDLINQAIVNCPIPDLARYI